MTRMDNSFKQALQDRSLENSHNFEGDLFSSVGWKFAETTKERNTQVKKPLVSEKEVVLESLKDFGEERLNRSEKASFKIPGGEVARRDQHSINQLSESEIFDMNKIELLEFVGEKLSPDHIAHRFLLDIKDKFNASSTKVMFVNDQLLNTIEDESSYSDDSYEYELLSVFQRPAAALFSKMIKAMNLAPMDFIVSGIEVNKDETKISYFDEVLSEILHFKPELIICLGASTTQRFLQRKERLANVHGQFFDISLNTGMENQFNFKLMPLFHPDLLLINPNMKKTTWLDMQKSMKLLGL